VVKGSANPEFTDKRPQKHPPHHKKGATVVPVSQFNGEKTIRRQQEKSGEQVGIVTAQLQLRKASRRLLGGKGIKKASNQASGASGAIGQAFRSKQRSR